MRRGVVLCLWLLPCCTFPTTQTIIEIQADAVVRQRSTEIRIEVTDGHANALSAAIVVHPRATDFSGFPIRIPISAKRGEDTRSFALRVTALETAPLPDGSVNVSTLATNQIRTGFARGRVLRATLWLLSGCRCGVDERCVPDDNDDYVPECKPIDVDVRVEVDARIDSGIDAALGRSDAATDSTTGDATVVSRPVCAPTQHVCEGRCVSNFSPSYCGATSCTACPAPEHAIEAMCSERGCGFVCEIGYNECQRTCLNLATDRMHCGSCGNACPGAQLCVNRQCTEPPQCTDESGCAAMGTYCNPATGRCETGCNDAADCSARSEACNTTTHRCDCVATHHRCSQTGNACVPMTQIDACGVTCSACATPSGATATCDGSLCDFACGSATRCGVSCSVCPVGTGVASTGCGTESDANRCVVLTCASGYQPNTNRTGCDAVCMPNCAGRVCGGDGCGGSCGACAAGACNGTGDCVVLYPSSATVVPPAGMNYGFGFAVALSGAGTTLAVGDIHGGVGSNGSVTVYARNGAVWDALGVVLRPDGAIDFGESVALSADGSTLAVGDPRGGGAGSMGAVTVYIRSGSDWLSQGSLSRPSSADDFGKYIVLSADGSTLAVGDPHGPSQGAITVYYRTGAVWSSQGSLARAANVVFQIDHSIAISADGSMLVAGTATSTTNSVTYYVRGGGSWSIQGVVPEPTGARYFGDTVALSADGLVLVVGDSAGYSSGLSNGTVTIYVRNGAVWTRQGALQGPADVTFFGRLIALSADSGTLAVASGVTSPAPTTIYTRSAGVWTSERLNPSQYAWDLALSADGSSLAVGSGPPIVRIYTR